MWPVFAGLTRSPLALLALTPGFALHELAPAGAGFDGPTVAALAAATAAVAAVLVWRLVPGQALGAAPARTGPVAGRSWLLYPLLSALPQELLFRVLFFRR